MTLGAKLFIDSQSELDEIAMQIALRHHEKWDGTGYPGHFDVQTGKPLKTDPHGKVPGLEGDEIPLMGRITSIADVYDALSTKRVYKEIWAEPDVLNEIRNHSGISFDPELVDIFFQVLPNIKQIASRYADS